MVNLMKVTLGITCYGGSQLLETCLASIKKSIVKAKYSNFEVVIVDDGSPTVEANKNYSVFKKWKHNNLDVDVLYVKGRKQMGNVERYNMIVKHSNSDIIYLLDNDLVVPDRWFWSAYYFLANNDNVGVASFLSQKVSDKEVKKLFESRHILADGSGRTPERATELAGYCFGFKKEMYKKVGGFDSKNFKYFAGDSDFCCKLAEKGFTSYRLLYPIVYHREHATYNAYKELEAWSRAKQDLKNFQKKWGQTKKETEKKLLKLEPRKIKWYANYSHHEDWDSPEKRLFQQPGPHMLTDEKGT